MDDKITIDRETLKAISSDTRMNLLKELDRKKQTLSDLSGNLKLSNPTIKEHLDVLVKAGLANREESKRKWKYYYLTFKGKQLLKPNETKLFLALVVSIVVGLGFFLFTRIGASFTAIGNNTNQAAAPLLTKAMNATADAGVESTTASSVAPIVSTAASSSAPTVTTAVTPSVANVVIPWNNIILTLIILVILVLFILYIKEKSK